ncbi:hypothetical protein C8J56DRAFT_1168358 [Mycena floridula]|nr:hypothetical protein C8J56DRAFT_1168358 [Mycena floridula]
MSTTMEPLVLCAKCGDSYETKIPTSVIENAKAYTADNVDKGLVTAFAADADCELQAYDAQIKVMEKGLKKLKAEREKVLQHRDRCLHLISAVRRVPAETWLEILGFACVEENDTNWQNPAIRIAGVCRQWRQISLSSPALWTAFVVDLREHHVTSPDFIEMHRQRSSPLTLSIRFNLPDLSDTCQDCRDIHCHEWETDPHLLPTLCSIETLADILQFSGRLSRFRFPGFHISNGEWIQALVERRYMKKLHLPPPFPHLETLEIGSGERYDGLGEEFDLGLFAGAVNLQHLDLSGYTGDFCPSSWTNLTTVDLQSVEITVIHHLLAHCQNLTYADIYPIEDHPPVILGPCVSTSLLSLKLSLPRSSYSLLQSLTLPALQSLELRNKSVDIDDLLALCERSSFPLRRLSLQGEPEDDFNRWEKAFLALPALSSFEFFGGPVSEDFLRQLTFSADNDHPVFPQVAELVVPCDENNLDVFVTMVESRFHATSSHIAALTKIIVRVEQDTIKWYFLRRPVPPLDPSVVARVKALSEAGLDIKIRRV